MFYVKKWCVQLAIFICVAYFLFSAVISKISFVQYEKSSEKSIGKILHQAASEINDVNIQLEVDNKNSRMNCCSDSYWDALVESDELTGTQIMEYFMWTNRSSCVLAHDFGGEILHNPSGLDGQKAVCIDTRVAPKPRNCIIYSFGINNDWSFDEDMEQYGCEVFAFDPSMRRDHHDHSSQIHFYNWGLSDRDGIETHDVKWEMYSLSSIYNILSTRHGPKVIDYLKMDIEHSEWKVLPDIIETGMLSKVRQLGIEVHFQDYTMDRFRQLVRLLRTIESMGMVRFDSKCNPWFISNFTHLQLWKQSAGYEIAWYNSKLFHSGV